MRGPVGTGKTVTSKSSVARLVIGEDVSFEEALAGLSIEQDQDGGVVSRNALFQGLPPVNVGPFVLLHSFPYLILTTGKNGILRLLL